MFDPWVGKIPKRRKWQPIPVFMPGKSHGQKSLPSSVHWVAESAMTEWVTNKGFFLWQELFFLFFFPPQRYKETYHRGIQGRWASLVAQLVKNLPAMQETWIWSLGWEDPLERGKVTHSSILAWRIPWPIESMGLQRVRHNWATFTHLLTRWLWRIRRETVSPRSWSPQTLSKDPPHGFNPVGLLVAFRLWSTRWSYRKGKEADWHLSWNTFWCFSFIQFKWIPVH